MANKRRLKRRDLIYYLSIFDRNTNQFVGQLVNITTEGIMLIAENPVKPNLCFEFRMVLPEKIDGRDEILFDAKSLWCKKDVNPSFYDVGFQIEKVELKDVERIQSLIHEFSFKG